jgi:hypothetical protein
MSLLHQDSTEEIDDASRGEEFTKGSSHVVIATIIAAVLVTAVIAVLVFASRKPPVATAEILEVWAHPTHGETSGVDANGEPMAKENFDQVLLFAHVRLHNQSKYPIFIENLLANARLTNGAPISVSAGSVAQLQEAFVAYPELTVPHDSPLHLNTFVPPGQSMDCTAFWVFRMTRRQWEARKDWPPESKSDDPGSKYGLNFTFAIQYQPSLVLAPSAPVMEQ